MSKMLKMYLKNTTKLYKKISFANVLFASLMIFVLILASCSKKTANNDNAQLTYYEFGGNFWLSSHNNTSFSLDMLKGKIVLLFFGYTYCPDACPITLNKLRKAFALLDKQTKNSIQILFVSVDPKRDSASSIKKYIESFNMNALGLTGSLEEIKKVTSLYKATFRKNFDHSPKKGLDYYTIDHTTFIYMIDQDSKLRYLFNHDSKPQFIANTIKLLL